MLTLETIGLPSTIAAKVGDEVLVKRTEFSASVNFESFWYPGIRVLLRSGVRVRFHQKVYFRWGRGLNSTRTFEAIIFNGADLTEKAKGLFVAFPERIIAANSLAQYQSFTVTELPTRNFRREDLPSSTELLNDVLGHS